VTTITVRHKPTDLLRLGLYATLRSPALRWTLPALAVALLGINLHQQRSHLDPITLIAIALTTAIFTGGAFILMLALIPLCTLLQNQKRSPATEAHTYCLTDAGLTRQSASSETLLKWGGARSLHKSKAAIYVGVSATSYFILPRHSFASDEEYRLFWNTIQKLAPNNALERTPGK